MRVGRMGGLCALLAGAAGCGSHDGGPPSEVLSIAIQGGDQQSGPAGGVLAQPLQVVVKNATGTPVQGVIVVFAREVGSPTQLSDSLVTTGLDGIARVDARLGGALIAYRFSAFLRGKADSRVTFTEQATQPPTLVAASRNPIQAGDTITLTGTDFNASPVGNTVFFGAARGRVLAGPTATTLRVVVPPCVLAGSVPITVQVGSVTTNPVTVTYLAPQPVQLAVNEAITLAGTELGNCLRLDGDSADYLVIPQYATAVGPRNPAIPFLLGNAGTVRTVAARAGVPVPASSFNWIQARFDLALRAAEHDLAPAAAALGPSRPDARPALEALDLGSTRSFRVLSSLDPGSSSFASVTGVLRFIGAHILLYVDRQSPTPGFSDEQLLAFGKLFDQDLYPIDVRTFGAQSDIDNNGHLIVLMTPIVNALTPAASCVTQGFVTGFFFGFDLASQSSNSNKGEIFYTFVPDPAAARSCAHSVADVGRIAPATFIHEFQHMISYNQHVLVRGSTEEAPWLNEGLSHIAEELGSRYYENKFPPPSGRTNPEQLFPDSSQPFINGDLFNSYSYLLSPDTVSLTLFSATGSLPERGAAWLFLRWLGDQRDSTIYGRLDQSSKTSVENIENATGETFTSLFGDFSTALYTDSLPGRPRGDVGSRLRFTSRNLRKMYQRLYDTNLRNGMPSALVPRPFPIAPKTLPYNGQVTEPMLPGTMDFFFLQTPRPSSGIGLRFSRSDGAAFDVRLKAQVGIFRLPAP
ncbi:MAG: IPT/TIG domain-containing protein [Gemmatimonadota bacterium]|nr:IPT/TIG domain-containing protein [Gemmatimonadota bacterium]